MIVNIDINNNIAWTCGKYTYIQKTLLASQEMEDWSNVEMLIKQPTINSIICICTMQDIIKKGMPVDKVDIVYKSDIKIDNIWNNVLEKNSKKRVFLEKYNDLISIFKLE